jgi:acyl-CoA dehydrogenase
LASSVLKYFSDHKYQASDKDFVLWSLDFCLGMIEKALLGIFNNFPNRFIAWWLKFMLFPTGITITEPSDKSNTKVARHIMSSQSEVRTRFMNQLFSAKNDGDNLVMLEKALGLLEKLKPVFQRLHLAQKQGIIAVNELNLNTVAELACAQNIISELDLAAIHEFERLRKFVISVDEFSKQDVAKMCAA